MPRRPNQSIKDKARWAKLSVRIIARKCGAEDYGLLDEAAKFECLHDAVETAWLENNSAARTLLYLYFSAPDGPVDLPKKLNNPPYRRHLFPPNLSATPPSLCRYIGARYARVEKFEKWSPRGVEPEASTRTVALLVKACRESGNGARDAFTSMISARQKEIRELKKAIERCCIEGLAPVPSASNFAQGLLSEPGFVPWQLGHVFLLRDIAIDDLETTAEQREGLRKMIALLRAHRFEA